MLGKVLELLLSAATVGMLLATALLTLGTWLFFDLYIKDTLDATETAGSIVLWLCVSWTVSFVITRRAKRIRPEVDT
jgi:hypothetical protein